MSHPDTLIDRQMRRDHTLAAKRYSRLVAERHVWQYQRDFGSSLVRMYRLAPESLPAIIRSYVFCGNTEDNMQQVLDARFARISSPDEGQIREAIMRLLGSSDLLWEVVRITRDMDPADTHQALVWKIYDEELRALVAYSQALDQYIHVHVKRVDLDGPTRSELERTHTPAPPAGPSSFRLPEKAHRRQCEVYETFLQTIERDLQFKESLCKALGS